MKETNVETKKNFENLEVNWSFLNKGGRREKREKIEIVIGFSIGTIATYMVGLSFLYQIVDYIKLGTPVSFNFSTTFWILSLLVMFALYLLRDRDKFWDNIKQRSLDTYRSTSKPIEISNYMDHDVLSLVDKLLQSSDEHRSVDEGILFSGLAKLEAVRMIIDRTGLKVNDLRVFYKQDENKERKVNLEKFLKNAFETAYLLELEYLDERALFVTLVANSEPLRSYCYKNKVTQDIIDSLSSWLSNESKVRKYKKQWDIRKVFKPRSRYTRGLTNKSIPELENFSRDLTALVQDTDDFTLSLSREEELDKLVTLLGKNETSILLIGAPGIGKTTLLKSLAVKMVVEDVPKYLRDKRLVEFNFNKAYLESKSLKEYISIFEKVLEGLKEVKNIVLVLDNFEQLLNTKKELSAQISNFIITATENNNIALIATTTPEGYERYIAQNDALARLFTKVEMKVPSGGDIQQIVADESVKLENSSNVKIGYDAVTTAIDLSEKYTTDRTMPDKALDLIREAVSYAKEQKIRVVDATLISKIVSERVGVQVGVLEQDEKLKLMNLEVEMKKRVVGQDKAVKAVSKAMRAERMGIRDDSKPIASFLFAGPTGVGKTEVARTLARIWFGGEDKIIRLDMSEYQEEENVKRLIGYKTDSGYYEEGYLTGAIKQKPFSLILLDELEKANPRVLDLFLQVLDEGRLKDGLNRDTNYKNCVIIATSNVGSKAVSDNIEGKKFEEIEKIVQGELREQFRVEFLNRFDDIIVFKPLSKEDIRKITHIMLNLKAEQLKAKGYDLEITNELIEKIAQEGYSPIWGARELKRVIDDEVNEILM